MTIFRINAGKYRHIITFQKLKDIQNSYGETDRNNDANWEDVMTVRAGIFPISGKDFFGEDIVKAEITHKIQVRFYKGLSSEMRIKFGNRIFDIVSPPINFQEKNMELQLMCKERNIPLTG